MQYVRSCSTPSFSGPANSAIPTLVNTEWHWKVRIDVLMKSDCELMLVLCMTTSCVSQLDANADCRHVSRMQRAVEYLTVSVGFSFSISQRFSFLFFSARTWEQL